MIIRISIGILLVASFMGARSFSHTIPTRTYTTADGLAQSVVSSFFQDSRGYMWFGTWGGISRYDGRDFWSLKNSGLRVTSIGEDAHKTLWIGTTSGLARLVLGDSTLHWMKAADSTLPSDYILSILQDSDSNMWVGTDAGLQVFTPSGTTLRFDRSRGLQDDHITGLLEDRGGEILISSGSGIMRCRLGEHGLTDSHELLSGTIIGQMILLRNGDILASSLGIRSVIRYHGDVWDTVFSCSALGPSLQVRSLGEDEQGDLWIGTTLGLVTIEDGHASRITLSHSLANQYIGAIFKDRENVLWFGTEAGAFKFVSTPFRSFNYGTGLRGDHVISVFEDDTRNHWFGMYNGAAMMEPGGRTTAFGLSEGLPHLAIHSFAQGKHGTIWIGSWGGLVLYDKGKLRPGPVKELRSAPVIRMLRDPDGGIWCGSRGKVLKATPDGRVVLTIGRKEGFPDAGTSALFMDPSGTLWFGTDARGGGYYRDGRVVLLDARHGLPDPWVMSINQDRHGTIWFATQHGVVSWNGQRFDPIPTTEEELRIGIGTFVMRDSLGDLWFGTQRGVYKWNDSLAGHLDSYDGLIADPTRCGYVDRSGDLWIGTVGGVSRLDVHSLSRSQTPPPLHIEGLALDDESRPTDARTFSYDENTLTAHFNSLSFKDERRTEFQWMLKGFDGTWQPPRMERHVRYTHLPWRSYEFLVRARNGRTAWSDPVRLSFTIRPPFWGTWWFIALAGACIALIVWQIHRSQMRRIEREKEAEQKFSRQLMESQEGERKRIAGELHDSLVQNLLVAKNKSLLGMRAAGNPDRVTHELSEISTALTDAIDEVREIAHNLRPYQLDRLGLTQALRSLAEKVSHASGTTFTTDIQNIDPLFTTEASTIIYRIVQECVNNILRHAGASEASIMVQRAAQDVRIVVRDNGRGFRNGSPLAPGSLGFGLNGIDQRARMLGGTVTIESAVNAGTELRITIPAHP